MERETKDLLIIAHESVLRVLCAYFLEVSADVRSPPPRSTPVLVILFRVDGG
jgi:broad specificity phosphatase PhoE